MNKYNKMFKRNPFQRYCPYFRSGLVLCNDHSKAHCLRCEFADRMREDMVIRSKDLILFCEKDAMRQTPKGGGAMWWRFPILLSEEVMERLGLEKHVFFQVAVADGGPGVFIKNPVGEIDCHLFVNPSKKITITRNEAYGIPDEKAVKRFDDLFFLDLQSTKSEAQKKIGVWCL